MKGSSTRVRRRLAIFLPFLVREEGLLLVDVPAEHGREQAVQEVGHGLVLDDDGQGLGLELFRAQELERPLGGLRADLLGPRQVLPRRGDRVGVAVGPPVALVAGGHLGDQGEDRTLLDALEAVAGDEDGLGGGVLFLGGNGDHLVPALGQAGGLEGLDVGVTHFRRQLRVPGIDELEVRRPPGRRSISGRGGSGRDPRPGASSPRRRSPRRSAGRPSGGPRWSAWSSAR